MSKGRRLDIPIKKRETEEESRWGHTVVQTFAKTGREIYSSDRILNKKNSSHLSKNSNLISRAETNELFVK